jgi:aldose 1-epimerase
VQTQLFGEMPDGQPIELFTLKSDFLEADLTSYGATILALRAPDSAGHPDNVVLALSNLDALVQNHRSQAPFFFGSTIGRYANRIANARFTLNGKQYTLPQNNCSHCLHGGPNGFYNVVWHAQPSDNSVLFRYLSKDGDEGFPGTLQTTVCFTLSGVDLQIDYLASTDKPTVINLTNHAYFNLSGAGRGSILDHHLKLFASHFTPVDAQTIPTGELRPVVATAFDFRKSTPIGARIRDNDEQLHLTNGYDHNFVIDGFPVQLKPAAELFDPSSGRVLEVLTTEPAIQFYSGNHLDGTARGKAGEPYTKHSGLCLETQHFPDSPNRADFPSTVLHPGQTFRSTTIYRFSTR